MATDNKAEMLAKLPVRPGRGSVRGPRSAVFYRRWFNLVDDLQPILDNRSKRSKAPKTRIWVPAWSAVASRYEQGRRRAALKRGDKTAARTAFSARPSLITASPRFSVALITPGSAICPPVMSVIKSKVIQQIPGLLSSVAAELSDTHRPELCGASHATTKKRFGPSARLPKGASASNKGAGPLLVMCGGADMYKEDREKILPTAR